MPTGTQMVVARCLHAPSSLVVMLPLFPHGTKEDLTRRVTEQDRGRAKAQSPHTGLRQVRGSDWDP